MAKKIINVGTTANDKKGDSLRAAFQKVNANFDELYTSLGLNDTTLNLGAVEFNGSVMSTTDSSPITIDQAVTISSDLTLGGDLLPKVNLGGNLGSPTMQWKSLYVSTNTIFINNIPLSLDTNNSIVINGEPISQNINYVDIPNAPTDIADLTDLTGLLNGGGNANTGDITFTASTMRAPNNTTLNVNAYSGSNVIAGVDLNPSTFDATLKSVWAVTNTYGTGYWTTAEWTSNGDDVNGTINITGSTTLFNLFTKQFQYASNIMVSINGSPAMPMPSRGYTYPDIVSIGTTDGFSLDPATVTEMTITFDTTAKFKANANGQGLRIEGGEGSIVLDTMYNTNINSDYIYLTSKTLQGSGVVVRTDYSGYGQGKEWQFNSDGTLSLPWNGTLQQGNTRHISNNGYFNIGTPEVVWSSSANYISSAKLLIQIECQESQDESGIHTQTCEAIISSRGWLGGVGEPVMTVYGVVHTSVDNLATFTVQRNQTTNVIEVLATPTLTAAGTIYYCVSATEITTWD